MRQSTRMRATLLATMVGAAAALAAPLAVRGEPRADAAGAPASDFVPMIDAGNGG